MMQQRRLDVESFYHLSGEDLLDQRCEGTACFVARHPDPTAGTVADRKGRVYCLGKCYVAPASANMTDRPRVEAHAPEPIVLSNILDGPARTLREYTARGGYVALKRALETPRTDTLKQIEASKLRGRGGAAFPTGKKWRMVAEHRSTEKFVVVNADEGDSGAYIDRFLIEDDPHRLIEAMTIAGYVTGATKGHIYVRKEYPDAYTVLGQSLVEARQEGILGARVLGQPFSFDIQLALGQGSYVCGEETALLNSLEGRRPEVRSRPPYPADQGLFGKPTLVNNVETLASIPWIVSHGGEAYHRLGFSKSRGTKVVSLNSLFVRPGLYEIEFGITLREIVEDLGGGLKTGEIQGLMIGGPLAGVIPPHLFDTKFGFEELAAIGASVGHGGIMAFDKRTSFAELIHHVFEFAAFESCGKCTPCRLGSRRIEQIFRQIITSGASPKEQQECREIISTLAMTSVCGLGTGLADFANSVLRHYSKEFEACFA